MSEQERRLMLVLAAFIVGLCLGRLTDLGYPVIPKRPGWFEAREVRPGEM